MKKLSFFVIVLSLASLPVALIAEDGEKLIQRAATLQNALKQKVFRDVVRPTWLSDGRSFWYRVSTGPDRVEYVLVHATTGEVKRAAALEELNLPPGEKATTSGRSDLKPRRTNRTGDRTRLSVRNTSAHPVEIFWIDERGQRTSFGQVEPGASEKFSTYAGHVWLIADEAGHPLGYFEATANPLVVEADGKPATDENGITPQERSREPGESPDAKWSVRFHQHNVQLVSASGETTHLTTDGTAETPYRGPVRWSSDSLHCVVLRVHEVRQRRVTVVESSPHDQLQPTLLTYDYFKPGDDLPQPEPVLIDVTEKKSRVIAHDHFPHNFTDDGLLDIRWHPQGKEFYFLHNQRGHQLYRVLAVNVSSGELRTVVEERSNTFIDWRKTWREWLDETGELLWMSERDGWRHLWLYNVTSGEVKNQVTRGEWVVRKVLRVDPEQRQIWFLASGLREGEDPYYHHLCRVNFDGTGMLRLTEGEGDHAVEFAPNNEYFIDRWSRVDLPPVTELRRSADGGLVCELERADISELQKTGWSMPERFQAKGRDGRTEIHGILIKPSHFDPQKKYPVVEEVYAGPQGAYVPKAFHRLVRQHTIAELGFIVVQVDGMGTNNRGKAFHDVCWKNLADAGFPDRIAWIRSAAETRPWMDLARVGIYGGSAGGQNAMRALIDHHDFYHVAVADCGCHDNRMDKIWWNEQWLGWPVDEAYARSSNVEHATRLKGKLLLIVGELDTNVDPASTTQAVGALQKVNRDFEYMPIIGAGHGAAETPYGSRRRMEFLIRHLLGTPPG